MLGKKNTIKLLLIFRTGLFLLPPVGAGLFAGAEVRDKLKSSLTPVDLEKIQLGLKSKGYLEVAYTQTISTVTLGREPRVSKGHAFFSATGKARLNQNSPEMKQVIFDGKSLVEFFPIENEANTIDEGGVLADRVSRLASMVLDFNQFLGEFSLRSSERLDNGIVEVEMASIKDSTILSVSVKIDEKKGFVSGVKILYRDQREHDFVFENPVFVQKDPNQFNFIRPKNVKERKL